MSRWKARFVFLVSVTLVIAMGGTALARAQTFPIALSLFEAINENDSVEVRRLLGLGVSLEFNYLMDQTPYQYAVRLRRTEIIKILFHEANLRRRTGDDSSFAGASSNIPSSIHEALVEIEEMGGDPTFGSEAVIESAAYFVDNSPTEQQSDVDNSDNLRPPKVMDRPAATLPERLPLTATIDGVDSEVADPTDKKPNATSADQSEGIPSFRDWATVIFGPPPGKQDLQTAPQSASDATTDAPPSPEGKAPQLTLGNRVLGASEPVSQQNCKQRNDYKVCRITISWIKRLGRVVRTDEALAVYGGGRARGYFVFFPVDLFDNARNYLTARFGQPGEAESTDKRPALGLKEHEWWATDNDTNHILSLTESAGYKHINLRVDEAMLSLVEEGFEDIVSLLRMSDFELALAD